MACGIVEAFAKAGYDVLFTGRGQDKVAGVVAAITKNFDKQIQRGRATEEQKTEVLGRVRGTTSLDDLKDVDLVVEAIAEDLAIKTTLFENLDEICKPGAILATTTSSLPIISMARATKRPQDVIGMHFFNPAAVMKLVEVVSTVATDEAVTETVLALCEEVGKVAVWCGDRSGFIVNALLFPYLNDAVKMLEAHYATADDIDTAMKQGCALPMGPSSCSTWWATTSRWRSSASSTSSSASRASRRRRCSSTSSRPATSAARPVAASATTALC